ncbi:MAG TPA: YajQ family cyclic di-GMP-binding protein [Bacteroidota bacterium]|nr:YajQ family cyclic di-GMP-binding protein [Bacteroidota bacterium]
MAQANSFDIVSEVNLQEVDNALNQARKEISQRYDFKDSKSSIDFNQKEKQIVVISDDEFRLKSVIDILQSKLIKRGVAIKALDYGKIEPAANSTVRQVISLRVGIEKENAKTLVKIIKDSKLKVQAQIMDDQVRVTGKSKDDLQEVMKLVRGSDLPFAMQFVNYR